MPMRRSATSPTSFSQRSCGCSCAAPATSSRRPRQGARRARGGASLADGRACLVAHQGTYVGTGASGTFNQSLSSQAGDLNMSGLSAAGRCSLARRLGRRRPPQRGSHPERLGLVHPRGRRQPCAGRVDRVRVEARQRPLAAAEPPTTRPRAAPLRQPHCGGASWTPKSVVRRAAVTLLEARVDLFVQLPIEFAHVDVEADLAALATRCRDASVLVRKQALDSVSGLVAGGAGEEAMHAWATRCLPLVRDAEPSVAERAIDTVGALVLEPLVARRHAMGAGERAPAAPHQRRRVAAPAVDLQVPRAPQAVGAPRGPPQGAGWDAGRRRGRGHPARRGGGGWCSRRRRRRSRAPRTRVRWSPRTTAPWEPAGTSRRAARCARCGGSRRTSRRRDAGRPRGQAARRARARGARPSRSRATWCARRPRSRSSAAQQARRGRPASSLRRTSASCRSCSAASLRVLAPCRAARCARSCARSL